MKLCRDESGKLIINFIEAPFLIPDCIKELGCKHGFTYPTCYHQ